jgi:hypothetical protein
MSDERTINQEIDDEIVLREEEIVLREIERDIATDLAVERLEFIDDEQDRATRLQRLEHEIAQLKEILQKSIQAEERTNATFWQIIEDIKRVDQRLANRINQVAHILNIKEDGDDDDRVQ